MKPHSGLNILVPLIALAIAVASPIEGRGEPRVALVIGNGAYAAAPLSDPPNDAELIAERLRALGFNVTKRKNVNQKQMRQLVRDFGKRLKRHPDTVGVFFYSGHGMQVDGRNYMIPIGATIEDESDVRIEAEAIDNVLYRMDAARNHVNVVILDACRNNPYEKRFKSPANGLAKMSAPIGSFIAFAAEPHAVAMQGDGRYSVFSEALAGALGTPGEPIEQVFKTVRREVLAKTDGRQVPTTESKLTADFSFVSGTGSAQPPRPAPPGPTTSPDWIAVNGDWHFDRQPLVAHGVSGFNKAYHTRESVTNGYYEASFRKISNNDGPLGLLFRYDETRDVGYLLLIWPHGGYQFSLLRGEQRTRIASRDPHEAVRRGTSWNTVRISADGPRLELSINGQRVETFTDTTLSTGRIGLVIHGGPKNAAEFRIASVQRR